MSDVFDEMARRWVAPLVSRTEISKFSGGAIRSKTLANFDCIGEGPRGRFRIGRAIVYPVPELVAWLRARSRPVAPKGDAETKAAEKAGVNQ